MICEYVADVSIHTYIYCHGGSFLIMIPFRVPVCDVCVCVRDQFQFDITYKLSRSHIIMLDIYVGCTFNECAGSLCCVTTANECIRIYDM